MNCMDAVRLTGVLEDRDAWRATHCSIGRAMEVVGTRSAMLILREAYYGTTRFDDFASRVGITEAVASARLKELTEAGLFVACAVQGAWKADAARVRDSPRRAVTCCRRFSR